MTRDRALELCEAWAHERRYQALDWYDNQMFDEAEDVLEHLAILREEAQAQHGRL